MFFPEQLRTQNHQKVVVTLTPKGEFLNGFSHLRTGKVRAFGKIGTLFELARSYS
jgi:hypothetical protein